MTIDDGLTPDLLLRAYSMGIFPMSDGRDDPDIYWVDPQMRGVLPLQGFHVSRSLARRIRAGGFTVTLNRDFGSVVEGCADRDTTWINAPIFDLYTALHRMGHAHSIEIWQEGGPLIGGVYGVALGGAFFGESMFSRATDASKIALAYLTAHLARQGFTLFDTQFLTPHLASLGAFEMPRKDYHAALQKALYVRASFGADKPLPDVQDVIQRNTQTS